MNTQMKRILCFILVVLILTCCVYGEVDFAKSKVSLNRKSVSLMVGESAKLSVKGSKKKVSWISKNPSVASVSKKGVVKAKKIGNTKIIAKVAGKKLACSVNVVSSDAPFYTFRNPDRLTEHYKKHGIEMGFSSEEEYLAAANAVIQNPDALHKLEAEDNDHVYFIEATGEIVFLSQDGYIRTYFISDRAYFDRQSLGIAA